MTRTRGGLVTLIVMAVTLAACAPAPPSASAPSVASAAPEPTETLPPDMTFAVRQREAFGLRADPAWVQAVAGDARARTELLGIPLMPEEEAALARRQASALAVADAVKSYAGAFGDEFGGVYIDQATGVVVALFTDRPQQHRIGILTRLGRLGPLDIRLASHSERELDALLAWVTETRRWMGDIEAVLRSGWVDIEANAVIIQISSANPGAARRIQEHYGVTEALLQVMSDGTGLWLLPRGTIIGRVQLSDGRAPGPNQLNLRWHGDGPGECGVLDMAIGVRDDGRFELPCSPGGWTVDVEVLVPDGGWVTLGSGHVVVPAGAPIDLTIPLREGAQVAP